MFSVREGTWFGKNLASDDRLMALEDRQAVMEEHQFDIKINIGVHYWSG